MTNSIVSVEIAGQRYPIRSSLDVAYVTELAAYVDEKMKAAAESATAHDTLRLAVLAALNIADEMFRCRESAGERARAVVDRTRAIEQMLDAALHS